MKASCAAVLVLVLLCAPVLPAQTLPSTQPTANPALRLMPRRGWWMDRHQAILKRLEQGKVDLIFLGDSITNNYDKTQPPDENFAPTWQEFYGDRNAVNMGFSGDQTGNLLWRLAHGEIDGIAPKAAVILIGTNNTASGKQTAEQTEKGIEAVVDAVHKKLHDTKILLMGILPSDLPDPPGKSETDSTVNTAMAQEYADSPFVTFLDIGSIFMKDGKLNSDWFYDPRLPPAADGKKRGPLHPDTLGQRMMAQAIEPTLAKLMGDRDHTGKPAR